MNEDVRYTLSLNDLLTGKLREADGAATKLEGTMSGVQSILGALGVAGGIAGVVAFGKQMIDAGTKVEDARVGLTTLLKDANEAGRVIDNTMQDATKTPFAFEGLLSANKALISAGENADGARETVLNLANAIAATGGGDDELQRMVVNLQQIKNTGKATALDIKQFAYAGINVYKVLDEAGVKYAKGQEITYTQITEALKKAHDKGGIYFNGLENMAGNTSVQISNLGDSMFQLSVKMFDDLKPAISGVISGLASMVTHLRNGWDWLVKHKEIIVDVAKGFFSVGAAILGYNLALKASVYWETLQYAWMMRTEIQAALTATAVDGLALSQGILNGLFLTGAGQIGLAVGALTTYAFYVSQLKDNLGETEGLIGHLHGVVESVTRSFATMAMGVAQIFEGVASGSGELIKMGASTFMKGASQGYEPDKKMGPIAGKDTGFSPFLDGHKPGIGAPSGIDPSGKAAKDISAKGATGTKAITINIEIGKLIETFKIETTNLAQSTGKIQEMITNTLLQAVNDASIVADV